MAARKKKSGRRPGKGKGANEIHRGPTRDPGPTGSVGCYVIFFAMLGIVLMILLFEVFGEGVFL
ncbi:MAG TPA: hypothetical protein H9836_15140 [Candidatus Nocardiopsis merdipullorum]|jgi:hypothetical protein|nr:hypothetical protein [Candidatus Nocardiopsis merdipullorum]